MLSLEVRKKAGGAELHRVHGAAITVGASSGNEVVVRARGVAGRHVRIFERDGRYQLDLFKGVDGITVNGRDFPGGPISAGDRITIGEATITVVNVQPAIRNTPIHEIPIGDTATPAPSLTAPTTEVEYRAMRLATYRLCRENPEPELLATALTDFLDREFSPTEWAVGELSPVSGFRAVASTFIEQPAVPPGLVAMALGGERVARSESVTGVLTLVTAERRGEATAVAILVREEPRLAARAVMFLEEAVLLAGIAMAAPVSPAAPAMAPPVREQADVREQAETAIETILRQTDDLKKIVDMVEREVIDRAMRRVEGNQSRGAEILNISRGSLIAKLKEYHVPDYRYMRRERQKRS